MGALAQGVCIFEPQIGSVELSNLQACIVHPPWVENMTFPPQVAGCIRFILAVLLTIPPNMLACTIMRFDHLLTPDLIRSILSIRAWHFLLYSDRLQDGRDRDHIPPCHQIET